MDIVEKARVFATAAHAAVGQVRKYTGEPYTVHLDEVATIVKSVKHTDAMIAAAYLHDTVEDTEVTFDLIEQEFGMHIADQVRWLTDISTPEMGNRAYRKAMDRAYISNASHEAQTVKLADLISNTRSIVKHDRRFARVYLEEKRLLLEVLTHGDSSLRDMAVDLLKESMMLVE